MAWYTFWRKDKAQSAEDLPPAIEQKQYTTAELLALGSRGQARFQDWKTKTAIEDGLKVSAIFFACVRMRYEAVGSVPWKVYKKASDGTLVEIPKHPLQALIDKPNPDFAWSELMQLVSMHLDLAGNAYWTEIRGGKGGLPVEVWPLIPYCIKIQPGAIRLIDKYIYTPRGTSTSRDIKPDDMVQFKNPNPDDFLFGLPTIQAAGRSVDIDRDAGQWQKDSLHNRGVSDYAVVLDTDTSPEQYDRIKELYREQQAGPKNARKPWFTTKDIKPLNQSAVEMDFVNSRMSTWQEIASAMGVPLPMIGILTDATLANIGTSRKIFWLDTVIPLLRMMRETLQSQLASEFGPDIVIDYVLDDVEALRENVGDKLANARKLWDMGVPLVRLDEMFALKIPDVKTIPGAETAFVSSSILPTDLDVSDVDDEGETPPIPDDPAANDEEKAIKLELLRVLAYGKR